MHGLPVLIPYVALPAIDVQAFPKAQSGADPLMGGPSPVDPAQLRELGIRVIEPPRTEGER